MERTFKSRQPNNPLAPAARSEAWGFPSAPISAEAVIRDLQSVLSAAVARLHELIGCEHVTAWALRDDGEPYVAAASFLGNPPVEPEREVFDLLCTFSSPVDLLDPAHPAELRQIAERFSCSAAAPVFANDEIPMAVLLTGDGGEAASPVRPRTLAALDAARRRLEGPLAGALAMGRLREIDEEVCRLDRLAALGSLASEIAHEVRNPLVSIKTFLQLLPERRDDPEFFTSFFEIASTELRRMERLLDVVLDHARPGTVPEAGAAVDVMAVLESVTELVRHRALKRGISLAIEAAPDLPVVAVEDDALRQIVLNLILNAVDATPDRGAVCLRAAPDAGGVAITLADSGPGIPEELRGRVFEPFFSTRSDRAGGLGLAITRRVVEGAGGTIAVAQSEFGGAEFRVWLPAGG
jgi:two-component system sensor histidine kinase HydH